MSQIYDLIIIGSGPAGLTAAIYAQRAKLDMLVLEKSGMSGGQILLTYEVDNYPGFQGINGFDLGMKFKEHADYLGVKVEDADIKRILPGDGIWKVSTEDKIYETKAIIVATGASYMKLGVPGEEELLGMGVSYCATCDGAFFKNREVAVAGGGNVAVEDAIFLARYCKKVYLIHRRNELRADRTLQDALFELPNVELVWDSVVETINGTAQVENIITRNVKTDEKRTIPIQGIFVAIGIHPNTTLLEGVVELDAQGYANAGEDGTTGTPGIFVAGDIRGKALRQIVTAVSDGANAANSVQHYLIVHK